MNLMIAKSILTLSGTFLLTVASSQKTTINGYISDIKTGERLAGASVFVLNRDLGTSSNTYGFYSITLPKDSVEISFSYVGYETRIEKLLLQNNLTLNIQLNPAESLTEVLVTSTKKESIQNKSQMSSIDLPVATIKSLPALLGESDLLKAIQLLPGIQGGAEGSSGIYVRGGGPDQNLILLDGVPVYNVSHMFGFFSVFNTDALQGVEVIKGGFPARYGGRLSSVIDIRMKEGNKNEFHGEGGIGLIASRLTLEGPLGKKKNVSYMISGRRTYIDLFMRPISRAASQGEADVGYYFYDLNAKVNFTLGSKDRLYLSGYSGDDKFISREDYESGSAGNKNSFSAKLKWGNVTAVARWNHEFSRKLFGNLTFYNSRYDFSVSADDRYKEGGVEERYFLKYFSGIRDWTARYDLDFLPSPDHFIKAGISATTHSYKPGALQSKVTSSSFNEDTLINYRFIEAQEYDMYVEDDIRLSSKFKVNLGVHASGFHVNQKFMAALQPRVSIRYLLTTDISLKASYVKMNQYIHLLTNSGVGLPTDLWVPVTENIPQQVANQGAIGIAWLKNKYEISVEGYYKHMKNIIDYKEGASYLNANSNWEDKVEIGYGWSYGTELFIQRKVGRLTGMFGYTWSFSNRKFPNLNNGKTFPYKYDRRHDLKVAGVYKINDRLEISGDWVYGTGQAVTLPTETYLNPDGTQVEVYEGKNNFRMRAFHHLDVSAKFSKKKKKGVRSWVISIYNVYNRQNAFFIYRTQEWNTDKPVFKQVSLFPIIPSISYQFKF